MQSLKQSDMMVKDGDFYLFNRASEVSTYCIIVDVYHQEQP